MAELPAGGGDGGDGGGSGSSGSSTENETGESSSARRSRKMREQVRRLKQEVDRQRLEREREPSGIEAGEPISGAERPGSPRTSPGPEPDQVEGPGEQATDGMSGRDPTGSLREQQGSPTSGGGLDGGVSGMGEQPPEQDPMAGGGEDGMGGGGLSPPTRAEVGGSIRAARDLAETEAGMLTQEQESSLSQARSAINSSFRAVQSDPGRGRPDPNAEVDRAESALSGLSATTRPARPEFGADVEGVDEIGSGAFDLPGSPGEAQEQAQQRVDDTLGGPTDRTAQQAEDARRGILDGLPGGAATGGLATAAAAGVVAPEPVTSVGGALALGGLAVGGVALETARRQGELGVPTSGGFLPDDEASPSGEGAVQETTIRLPGVQSITGGTTVPAAEPRPPEIDVPDLGGSTGEVPVPELGASVLEQTQRQQRREERDRQREEGSPFGGGASQEELDDILQGPEEEVVIGEETGPEADEDAGNQFVRERDTDPRVIEPEESAGLLDELQFDSGGDAATAPSIGFDAAVGGGSRSAPAIPPDPLEGGGGMLDRRERAQGSSVVGRGGVLSGAQARTADAQAQDVTPTLDSLTGQRPDVGQQIEVGLDIGQQTGSGTGPAQAVQVGTGEASGFDVGLQLGQPTQQQEVATSQPRRRGPGPRLDFEFDGGDDDDFDFGVETEARGFIADIATADEVLGTSGGSGGGSGFDFGVGGSSSDDGFDFGI